MIVVGYAARPESHAAVRYAVDEALAHDAKLHLVRIIGMPNEAQGGVSGWADAIDRVRTSGEALVSELTGRGIDVTFQLEPAEGDPASTLLESARERSADMIVIGLRRRSRVGKLVLGSIAQDVLLTADCPVVAVKAED